MKYKRTSFCGPAGDGVISQFLSFVIAKILEWLDLNFEKSCNTHDVDWDDGPNTRNDIQFALNVYDEVKEKKGASWAWFISLIGFLLVRCTAVVYKLLRKFK